MQSQTITVPTVGANNGFTATQSYTYDSLNRLKSATENITPNGGASVQSWKQAFLYDRYGNRNFDTTNNNTTTIPTGCTTAQCNPAVSVSNNRFTSGQGYSYDSAGNVITDAQGRTFAFDAENKQKEVRDVNNIVIGTYFYDGDGKRVKKVSNTETVIFVYDAAGKLVAEYANQTPVNPQVSYLTNDHLGSPRITTDANGNVISRRDFHPFGEEIYTAQRTQGLGYTADNVKQKFTGYIRDDETDLDFAQARYYKSAHGRFTSVDPLMASAKPAAPQTWNRFAYVLNNPLKYIDPSGQCTAPSLGKGQVGICIEAFISTQKIQGSSIGHGDGRSIQGDGNNPNLTYRIQVQIVLTATKDKVSADYTVSAGVSRITTGVSGDRDKSTGQSAGAEETSIGFQGTASAKVSGEFVRPKGSEGFGTTTLNVTGTAQNGVSAYAEDLQKSDYRAVQQVGAIMEAVGPPAGTIDFNMNFKISDNGTTTLIGGATKGYPTYAAYSYRMVDGKLQTQTLKVIPEGKIEELTQPMKPIQ